MCTYLLFRALEQQQQQQQQNFINEKNNIAEVCPQLARLFKVGKCVQNIKIKTKVTN